MKVGGYTTPGHKAFVRHHTLTVPHLCAVSHDPHLGSHNIKQKRKTLIQSNTHKNLKLKHSKHTYKIEHTEGIVHT